MTTSALILALAVLTAVLLARRRSAGAAPPISPGEWLLCAALFGAVVFLRAGRVESLHGGRPSVDESQAARIYVASIVRFEPALHGATNFTHAWLLDAWYRGFGIGLHSPRWYAAAAGLLGLGLFCAALRPLLGARAAVWATLLLGLSSYAVYFSVAALEQSSLMLVLPLGLLLFGAWLRRPSLLRSAALGIVLGLATFTYPGILVGYAAVLAGWAVCAAAQLARAGARGFWAPLERVGGRALAAAAAGGACVLAAVVLLHERVYSTGAYALLHGGGALRAVWGDYVLALPVVLADLFVRTTSWHLPFQSAAFVEWAYWPLALLGAGAVWTRHPHWMARGLVASSAVIVLLVPLCGPYPGMRRGVVLLFPVCALAGAGVEELHRRLPRTPAIAAALLASAAPGVYLATVGAGEWSGRRYAVSYGAEPIPDAILLAALERHTVLLNGDEFTHFQDRLRVLHFWKLAQRHGVLRRADNPPVLVSPSERGRLEALLRQPSPVLLTWRPEQALPALGRSIGLCFGYEGLERRPAQVRLAAAEAAGPADVCPWPAGEEAAVASCARVGAGYPVSRVVHSVACDPAAHCDYLRPHFAFVEPGTLSLRLRAPAPGSRGVRLVLRVPPSALSRRANRIFVNGRDIGVLVGRSNSSGNRLSKSVPPEAWTDDPVWSVRIGPAGQAGVPGWDVASVALTADGDASSEDPLCLQALCVSHAGGEVCEAAAPETPPLPAR